jgi:hypothetical protein
LFVLVTEEHDVRKYKLYLVLLGTATFCLNAYGMSASEASAMVLGIYLIVFAIPVAMLGIAAVIALGLIPATIAKSEGKSWRRWWLYGTLLVPVALVHSIMVHAGQRCPSCSEPLDGLERVCPHRGKEIPSSARSA